VNRTARLESLCKEFEKNLIISETVFQTLGQQSNVKFASLGQMKVKGLASEMSVFWSLS
jgi:class 3 adenylate cyclase